MSFMNNVEKLIVKVLVNFTNSFLGTSRVAPPLSIAIKNPYLDAQVDTYITLGHRPLDVASDIGEACGVKVLSRGKARYTQYPPPVYGKIILLPDTSCDMACRKQSDLIVEVKLDLDSEPYLEVIKHRFDLNGQKFFLDGDDIMD